MSAKTDRQTDTSGKTSRWQITVHEQQWPLMETMPPGISWWGWQKEICPTTDRPHYQGCMISRQQHRWSGCKGDYKVAATLRQMLPGVHIEPADNWQKLLQYCKKEDTRAPGSEFQAQTNSIPTHFQYAETVAKQYVELYGLADLDDCEWDPPLLTRTKLISIMDRLDTIVNTDITEGRRYAVWITTNPAWKNMWSQKAKPYLRSFGQKDQSATVNAPPRT